MRKEGKKGKVQRILIMHRRLLQGETLNKHELSEEFCINERSVQRDIDELRNYVHEENIECGYDLCIHYDTKRKGYVLIHIDPM